MSIRISRNGLKYSSCSTTEPGTSPMFKCPNCGCYYDAVEDVVVKMKCNECGTELEICDSSDLEE